MPNADPPVRHEPCPLGAYALEARFEGTPSPILALAPGLLQLVSSAGNDVKITAVFPLVEPIRTTRPLAF